MQLGGMESVSVTTAGFDNLCGLYLTVLEDLWNTDSGLNSDITELGIDLIPNPPEPVRAGGGGLGLRSVHGTFSHSGNL